MNPDIDRFFEDDPNGYRRILFASDDGIFDVSRALRLCEYDADLRRAVVTVWMISPIPQHAVRAMFEGR